VTLGRWSWIGHGCKVRVHEGELAIGAKSVLGQDCTISAFQHVSIGRECVVADRVMMIDFDHGMVEVERSIREQGDLQARRQHWPQRCGSATGPACCGGSPSVNNSVIGTSSVVTCDVPSNAVVGGIPAKLIRMREAPRTFRWG